MLSTDVPVCPFVRASIVAADSGSTDGSANAIANNITSPIIFNVFKCAIFQLPSFFAMLLWSMMRIIGRLTNISPMLLNSSGKKGRDCGYF